MRAKTYDVDFGHNGRENSEKTRGEQEVALPSINFDHRRRASRIFSATLHGDSSFLGSAPSAP